MSRSKLVMEKNRATKRAEVIQIIQPLKTPLERATSANGMIQYSYFKLGNH